MLYDLAYKCFSELTINLRQTLVVVLILFSIVKQNPSLIVTQPINRNRRSWLFNSFKYRLGSRLPLEGDEEEEEEWHVGGIDEARNENRKQSRDESERCKIFDQNFDAIFFSKKTQMKIWRFLDTKMTEIFIFQSSVDPLKSICC